MYPLLVLSIVDPTTNMLSLQVIHRPSIGRYTKLEEPKARESLLTPAMRHSSSKSSLRTSESSTSIQIPTTPYKSSSTLGVETPNSAASTAASEFSPLPMVKAANAALMERPQFAIDDAGDDDDDTDEESEEGGDDDQVMDEVRPILRAQNERCLMSSML